MGVLPTAGLLALLALPRSPETAAAREQARLCEDLTGEESLTACRAAIAIGLDPARLGPVRQILARRLSSLGRWPELAQHFREDVALHPHDADANLRLGSTLLFGLGLAAEAEAALREATRLVPESAWAHAVLAVGLHALGRPAEATAEFEEALRLDDTLLEHRPAARAIYEAARAGEAWP